MSAVVLNGVSIGPKSPVEDTLKQTLLSSLRRDNIIFQCWLKTRFRVNVTRLISQVISIVQTEETGTFEAASNSLAPITVAPSFPKFFRLFGYYLAHWEQLPQASRAVKA